MHFMNVTSCLGFNSETLELKSSFTKANGWFQWALREKLSETSSADIRALFQKEEDFEGKWGNQILSCIKEETLLELAGITKEELEGLKKKELSLRDKALESVLQRQVQGIVKEMGSEMLYFFDHTISLMIDFVGLQETTAREYDGQYTRSSMEAKFRLETLLAVILIPSTIFGFYMTSVGVASTAFLLTALTILSALSFILVYNRFLKPCPRDCMGLDNLNQRAKRGTDEPTFVREDILRRIETAFESGMGVLLVGKTGVGKTSLVRSLAESIEKGKCSEKLKDKQIFSCNANSFGCSYSRDGVSLNVIRDRFDRYKDEVIFFFDEIHAAFNTEGNKEKNASHDLKTFFDHFRSSIVATTDKEFKKIEDQAAFLRRFVRIDLQELQEEEIKASLYQLLHRKNKELLVDSEAIDTVIERAGKKVNASQTLLREAISKATYLSFDDLERELQELRVEKENADNAYLHHGEKKEGPSQLEAKEKELAVKKRKLEQIRKIEAVYVRVWNNSYKLADKGNRQWLENKALLKLLQDVILERKEALGLPPLLTKELIDSLVEKK